MIKFNPEEKENLTWGDIGDPAMQITDQKEADEYLEDYVNFIMKIRPESSKLEASVIARSNFGYFAGYFSDEVRERVERLFNTEHPIFGKISINGSPTKEEAFEMGKKFAESRP